MIVILFFAVEFVFLIFVITMLHLAWRPIILGEPPYYPTPARAIETIIKELELNSSSILYDLGCGDGRILFECLQHHPTIQAVGVEYNFVPYLRAQFEKRRSAYKSNIRFIKGDMFEVSCHEATHVFLFTYPEFMDRLLPRLQEELKPGTRVVALDFPFLHKTPQKIVDIPGRGVLGRCVYVYEF